MRTENGLEKMKQAFYNNNSINELGSKHTMQATPTASEFYRDIPEPDMGWEKFESDTLRNFQNHKNMKEDSSDDDDVFYYAEK